MLDTRATGSVERMTLALVLRGLEPRDAPSVHAISVEPEVARTLGGTPFEREEDTAARLAGARADKDLYLGAFDEGVLVGWAHLEGEMPVRRRHVARLAVAVRPSMQRRGVGTRLVGALVEAADRWWGYTRLELGVLADHAAAVALYEKHGFVVETRRRGEMLVDGTPRDCLGMARLRAGWRPLPALGEPPPIPPWGPRREVVVRTRRVTDGAAYAALHSTESVMEGTFQLPYQTEAGWQARFASTAPGATILAAEVDGRLVGSAGLFPLGQSPRFAHVRAFGIAVLPEMQGAGVGEALMRATLDHADRWLGLHRVMLEVFVDNARARALYGRHGFVLEGVERAMALRRGAHEDSYVMGRVRL